MDMPEIVAAPEQRHAILRYLNGTQICTDHIRLQEAAMLISPNDQAEPQPTNDVNREAELTAPTRIGSGDLLGSKT
jgi:hypothetical protein